MPDPQHANHIFSFSAGRMQTAGIDEAGKRSELHSAGFFCPIRDWKSSRP
jgi:hypothetical protein